MDTSNGDHRTIHAKAHERMGDFMFSIWSYVWALIKASNEEKEDSFEYSKVAIEMGFINRHPASQMFNSVEIVFMDGNKSIGSITVKCGDASRPNKKEIVQISINKQATFKSIKSVINDSV